MATVTKPIALDESFNTTETPSRNIADVLASLGDAISQGAQPVTKKLATNSFKTINGGLVDGLTVQFTPVQDLHGQSKPWAEGAGKNKMPLDLATIKSLNTDGTWSGNVYSWRGIDYTVEVDSDNNVTGISASGTATQRGWLYLCSYNFGNESIYFNNVTSGGYTYTSGNSHDNTSSQFIYYNASSPYNTYLRIDTGVTLTDEKWYPMVRLSSIADPTFEPYSNICPISGHTEAKAKINDTVYTTSLGGTEYGGEVDQVSGDGVVDTYFETFTSCVSVDVNPNSYGIRNAVLKTITGAFVINTCMSDKFERQTSYLADTKTVGIFNNTSFITIRVDSSIGTDKTSVDTWLATNPVQIAVKLATPTTLTLTGQNITAEVGENNVSAPLTGQNIKTDSVIYKDMFTWEDVLKVI